MLSLSALADPTRRRIVELLAKEEYTAGEIVEEFDMSAPAISQHLKILREAGLLKVRVEGQRRVHSLNPDGFAELDAWLHRMRIQGPQRSEPPARRIERKVGSRAGPALAAVSAGAESGWEIIKMENP
ncbi:MAG: winged helix-turn-helix transcriptional regulator [Opitutae bacterium]|nr:winged helix-turn-helix transcriptional regulator [Opitutae bacterium]